ncbi:STM3941 family protein [Ligilactobacillus ceti]|uniref:Uncharacterized protein n=1 Tax=Ligilactobacillus ceti DSM 22408 TaxID=1122146 RepID=A0A0R2KG43_9LACO|nr:STM3941 family protein [Ligilactobacillus ceti]KRN88351.1 hypothetical protein IV53_GL000315 [Ligilactobacillus ceti DSM 22408]
MTNNSSKSLLLSIIYTLLLDLLFFLIKSNAVIFDNSLWWVALLFLVPRNLGVILHLLGNIKDNKYLNLSIYVYLVEFTIISLMLIMFLQNIFTGEFGYLIFLIMAVFIFLICKLTIKSYQEKIYEQEFKDILFEVKLSRIKQGVALVAAMIMLLMGMMFTFLPLTWLLKSETVTNQYLIYLFFVISKIVGIGGLVFFGYIYLHLLRSFFAENLGLFITEEGIYDNTSTLSIGFIKWNDIMSIQKVRVILTDQKFISIAVKNPLEYISTEKNFIAKWFMKINMKFYGTPVIINSNFLKIDLEGLEYLLKESLNEIK